MSASVRVAVFPVAGLGTRFLPATKAIPKEMLTVIDRPLIQYAVDEAREAGIETFIFITAQGKTAIEDHFDTAFALESTLASRNKHTELALIQSLNLAPGQAVFIRQQEPKGLGHAVWCDRHLVGTRPFALILPDDFILGSKPCLQQMTEAYQKLGGNLVAAVDVLPEQVSRYGILGIAEDNGSLITVNSVVEKPASAAAPSCTAIIGRYILQPEIFPLLEKQAAGVNGEIQLTDAFTPLLVTQPFHGIRFEGQRFDCGTREGWLEANIAAAYAHPELRPHLLQAIQRHVH
ncbi:MAG: UTP--glucose-1-phosphate uridylyltransferase [Alphaproteobacteria bacterium]